MEDDVAPNEVLALKATVVEQKQLIGSPHSLLFSFSCCPFFEIVVGKEREHVSNFLSNLLPCVLYLEDMKVKEVERDGLLKSLLLEVQKLQTNAATQQKKKESAGEEDQADPTKKKRRKTPKKPQAEEVEIQKEVQGEEDCRPNKKKKRCTEEEEEEEEEEEDQRVHAFRFGTRGLQYLGEKNQKSKDKTHQESRKRKEAWSIYKRRENY